MYCLGKQLEYKLFTAIVRCYSFTRKTHYEVLKLRKNCSEKDIKEAFIKMSKQYHPDKNKDAAAQENFVRILEAYNVLGKPGSRAKYDSTIEIPTSGPVYNNYNPYHTRRPTYNQYSYQYAYQSQSQNSQSQSDSFYGIKGLKKVPNYVIILMCCSVAMVGCFLQMFVIRELYVAQRQQAHEKSKRLAEELEKVREAAKQNTNEVHTRLLLEKIVAAANPTVATASLGQALASEKKDTGGDLFTGLAVSDILEEDIYGIYEGISEQGNHYTFCNWCL